MILHLYFCLLKQTLATPEAMVVTSRLPIQVRLAGEGLLSGVPILSLHVGSILVVGWLTWRQNGEETIPFVHKTEIF